ARTRRGLLRLLDPPRIPGAGVGAQQPFSTAKPRPGHRTETIMADWNAQRDALQNDWETNPRWKGIRRDYTAEDVLKLRPSIAMEYSLAKHGANRLWAALNSEPFVPSLGAMTGGQAAQMVKAGLPAIYVSGWQVAADANLGGQVYPDQ